MSEVQIRARREKPTPPPVPADVVVLELDLESASFLKDLIGSTVNMDGQPPIIRALKTTEARLASVPEFKRREICDEVYAALLRVLS